jgi:LysR family transcriptional regulator, pca operon transcriptional activator
MRRYLDQKLKLRQLRVVDAIATHRSLQRAARTLGQTQPALTKTLHEVEAMVGARLFDRHARGMEPNALGRAVAGAARRILAEVTRLEEDLDGLEAAAAGTVAIGALPVAAAGVLPGALRLLRERHPDLRVRLVQGTTEQLLPALASGEVDLVVGQLYPPVVPDGLEREPLWDEPVSVLVRAGHPLLAMAAPTAADLAAFDLVIPTLGQRIGRDIDRVLATLGMGLPTGTLRASSITFIREMLLTGDAVTLIPRLMLRGDIDRALMAVVPLALDLPPRPAGIIRLPGRVPAPGVAAVTDCIRETVRGLGA